MYFSKATSPAQVATAFKVTEFVAVSRNSLRGFCTVAMPSGMILHDVSVHRRDEGAEWASPPAKPMLDRSGTQLRGDNNKLLWSPVITFASKQIRDRWSASVLEALRSSFPDVLS